MIFSDMSISRKEFIDLMTQIGPEITQVGKAGERLVNIAVERG